MVLPVVVVLVLVSVGFWVQERSAEDESGPELSRPSTPDTPSTGTWTPATLTGMSLLQAWTGSWLPLTFRTLSLLKPLGPPWSVAAPASGADRPTSDAVA